MNLIMSEYEQKLAPMVNTEEDDVEDVIDNNQIEELSAHE